MAIAQFAILSDEIYAQRQQARVVEIAATQRMLSVEIASLASAFVDASKDERPDVRLRLATDVRVLLENARVLVDPTSPANPRDWPPAHVRALFARGDYDVTNRTRDFARHGTRLLATPERSLGRSDEDLIFLSNVASDLAFRYGAVVAAYIDAGDAQRARLLTHEWLGLIALLLTLALELPLIVAPLEAELDEQVHALVNEAYKLSGAQRIAHLGTWERDLASGHTDWSDELRRICMLEHDEPTPPQFAAFDHPGDSADVRVALAAARSSREPYRIDHRIETRTGETRWIQESVEFVRREDGSIARELGTAFDITERKRAEAELYRQANHDVLTGLPNRRYLRDRLEAELGALVAVGRVSAYSTPISTVSSWSTIRSATPQATRSSNTPQDVCSHASESTISSRVPVATNSSWSSRACRVPQIPHVRRAESSRHVTSRTTCSASSSTRR